MTLKSAIKNRKIAEIRRIAKETPIANFADMLEQLNKRERLFFFRLLNTSLSADIFSQLEHEFQEELIRDFTDVELKSISEYLYADDLADIIEEVPANISNRILSTASKEKRQEVNKLLKYSDEQTGSIMSIDIVDLPQSMTVSKALKKISAEKEKAELVHYYFVVNQKGKLVGAVTLEDLVFAPSSKKVKDVMDPTSSVKTTTDKEDAALIFSKHDFSELPVVNSNGYLVGMITADDIIDVVNEEATEDIQKMAGIETVATPYLKTTVIKLFRSRVMWLMLLMISSTISQIVLDAFIGISANTFKEKVGGQAMTATITSALITIIPVISGAAGNAGSQASTMVTRSIALGEIHKGNGRSVLWKELRIGLLIGFVLGLANFIRLIIYYTAKGEITGGENLQYIWISFGASLALWVVIVFAKFVGGALPLLAEKMKIDPAVMAAPLLTTLIDAISTLMFFSISIAILLLAVV